MEHADLHVVTGALGYSGRYIADRLLARGNAVRTLTNSPDRPNPFGDRLEIAPLDFGDPDGLRASLEGARVLYNTYWVRFNHALFTHAEAVANTLKLFEAAKDAGVQRIVHVSITNPSLDSPLEYFRSKAQLEEALRNLGLSWAVLRPAVLFGEEDILVNNIAWALRKMPVFGVFGSGDYHIQPIHVHDFADLAVELGANQEQTVVDAVGPETYTYRELVRTIGDIIGVRARMVSVPPSLGYLTARIIGRFVGDVMLTRDEIDGLMADLLHVPGAAVGETKLSEWAADHRDGLGIHYASELARRKDRTRAYRDL